MSCSTPSVAAPPIRVVRGASWTLIYTVRDRRKNPVDLTGAAVWFTVKNRVEDPFAAIAKRNVLAGGIDNQVLISVQSGLSLGQFQVFGDPADTLPLDPAETYACDAFVQLTSGPPIKRYQVDRRGFVIEAAVTTVF